MTRILFTLFFVSFVTTASHGAGVQSFVGDDTVISWYKVNTPSFAGPGTTVSATNTSVTTSADIDESALTIIFDGLSFGVQSDRASFGSSAVLPPGSLTPIAISIRVTFDAFSGQLSASDPLQLNCGASVFCNFNTQPLDELTSPINVTGSYEILVDNSIYDSGAYSVDMAPTGLFPGDGDLSVQDFPDSVRFRDGSIFGQSGFLYFATVGDTRIFDTNVQGIPVFFDLNGWGAGLNGYQLTNVIPIPAAVWLFGSALGLLGWLRRKAT